PRRFGVAQVGGRTRFERSFELRIHRELCEGPARLRLATAEAGLLGSFAASSFVIDREPCGAARSPSARCGGSGVVGFDWSFELRDRPRALWGLPARLRLATAEARGFDFERGVVAD